jgi:hypothetical protein
MGHVVSFVVTSRLKRGLVVRMFAHSIRTEAAQ